ncbi:MAG: DUF3300 domain-containing protein [Deltaproteobacteria bacterium]|nr:DUF3300 domain-containing protein [Candidatus Anaeroferrophillus wilburensis]MBN2890056.1 DUF3300 domain-containing protein [Deltaproteobacteria bacterium]
MKAAKLFLSIIILLLTILLMLPTSGQALDEQDAGTAELYTKEQLAQMLAPIALYPDALLSQVLMASTYPLEIIEADRWIGKNQKLTGDDLDAKLQDKDWDPSVKALCHFPSLLALMSEKITETTNLGNAFLAQEDQVIDTIQQLRTEAHKQGNLTSDEKQKVIVKKEVIVIEPADPGIVYVPYYNSLRIYGSWWYPYYPPYYWGPGGRLIIGAGISFWPGPFISFSLISWSTIDWYRRVIFIDIHQRPRFFRHDEWRAKPGIWYHAPVHRRGVAYRDKPTARKYGRPTLHQQVFRRDIRGFPEPAASARRNPPDIRKSTPVISRKEVSKDKDSRNLQEEKVREKEKLDLGRVKEKQSPASQEKRIMEKLSRSRQEEKLMKEQNLDLRKRRPAIRDTSPPKVRQGDRDDERPFSIMGDGRDERRSSQRGSVSRKSQRSVTPGDGRTGGRNMGQRKR